MIYDYVTMMFVMVDFVMICCKRPLKLVEDIGTVYSTKSSCSFEYKLLIRSEYK